MTGRVRGAFTIPGEVVLLHKQNGTDYANADPGVAAATATPGEPVLRHRAVAERAELRNGAAPDGAVEPRPRLCCEKDPST